MDCSGTGQDGEFRAGVGWPDPRFAVAGDCVTDGLTWLKSPDSTPRPWSEALAHVATLSDCGSGDRRLPNILERESLVNLGQDG
jgi:hypothetical protein